MPIFLNFIVLRIVKKFAQKVEKKMSKAKPKVFLDVSIGTKQSRLFDGEFSVSLGFWVKI